MDREAAYTRAAEKHFADDAPELGTYDEAFAWAKDLAGAGLTCLAYAAAFILLCAVLGLAAGYLSAVDWMDLLRAWP